MQVQESDSPDVSSDIHSPDQYKQEKSISPRKNGLRIRIKRNRQKGNQRNGSN